MTWRATARLRASSTRSPTAIAGRPRRKLVIEIDHRADSERRRAVHQRSLRTASIRRSPRRLRKTTGICARDPRHGERLPAPRQSVEQGATNGPRHTIHRPSAPARRVVQRPIHRRCQTFRHYFLNVELADIRSHSPTETLPPTVPFDRIISRLVDRGVSDPLDGAVAEITNETAKAWRRIGADARLRVGRFTSERGRCDRDHEEYSEFVQGASVEVIAQEGNRRANASTIGL